MKEEMERISMKKHLKASATPMYDRQTDTNVLNPVVRVARFHLIFVAAL